MHTIQKKTPAVKAIVAGSAILALLGLFGFSVRNASAGPISGGAGNPPFVKVGVYQGVISIVPGGSGDHIMEIGNGGRDIASTGDINIRPQATSVTNPNLYARFYHGGSGKTALAVPGPLCLNGLCINTWADLSTPPGATPNLDAVLGAGNASTRSASLGSATAPTSKLIVNNGTTGTGSAGDSIASYANTTNAAIYAQQNGNGYAGYYSSSTLTSTALFARNSSSTVNAVGGNAASITGDVLILENGVTAPSWNQADLVKIASSFNPTNWVGYTLDVRNTDATGAGMAVYIGGSTHIAGIGGAWISGNQIRGALEVNSAYSGGLANGNGVGIYGSGGLSNFTGLPSDLGQFGVPWLNASAGVLGHAYNHGTTFPQRYSYGVIGWSDNTVGSNAAFFHGNTIVDGGLFLGAGPKFSSTMQVCKVDNSHCLGPYIRTTGSTVDDLNFVYFQAPQNVTRSVRMFRNVTLGACPASSVTNTRNQTTGVTYFENYDCEAGGSSGFVIGTGQPHGNGEQVCVSNTGSTRRYRSRRTESFGCQNFVDNNAAAFQTSDGRAILNDGPASITRVRDYELR